MLRERKWSLLPGKVSCLRRGLCFSILLSRILQVCTRICSCLQNDHTPALILENPAWNRYNGINQCRITKQLLASGACKPLFMLSLSLCIFLATPEACGEFSSPSRDQTSASSVETWSLNHWNSREFPVHTLSTVVTAVNIFLILQLGKHKIAINCSEFRRRQWHPTPVLLPGKSHGWRSLVGCNPWGC